MMPGQWKGPPHQPSQDGLTDNKGQDVALFGEQPAHYAATESREWNQDWVWPMQRAEHCATQDRGCVLVVEPAEQAVHGHGLQCDLLQNTEGEVTKQAVRVNKMRGRATKRAKRSANEHESGNENREDKSRAARSGP